MRGFLVAPSTMLDVKCVTAGSAALLSERIDWENEADHLSTTIAMVMTNPRSETMPPTTSPITH